MLNFHARAFKINSSLFLFTLFGISLFFSLAYASEDLYVDGFDATRAREFLREPEGVTQE
jgi:hypothetical protein